MWYKNEVTDQLNIQYPIFQAGMAGGITTPELVSAVCKNGALGNLGAGYMTSSAMREGIQKIKALTREPFGVNVFVPENAEISEMVFENANEWLQPFREKLGLQEIPELKKPSGTLFEEQIQVIIEEKVPICSFTFGLPPIDVVQELKHENIIIIATATIVNEAILCEKVGADIVIAQGSEAGGHRGTFSGAFEDAMIGVTALVPQIVDQVSIPVIAAGGIMDGRGILSALMLGAQGAQMGTAFVTSVESGAKQQHKDAILHAVDSQTVVTSTFSGKPARGITNDFILKMAGYEEELPPYPIQNTLTQPIRQEAAKQNRPEWMSLWSGQAPRLSKRQDAGTLISDMISQIERIMAEKLRMW